MASITSLSNSSYNTNSIYGNRNVLSGLASGMDTESMIENAVSGIKLKIQNLQTKRTKIEWQQEAYRSIIDKAVNFNNKYTSYSSKTNLMSNSFFSNAVNTAALGTYADKVSASGKTSSDIKINGVKQLASAATYTVKGLAGLNGQGAQSVIGGENFDITGKTPVSTVSGTLSFQYGGTNGSTFDISFDELENLDELEGMKDSSAAEKLAKAIQNKLDEVTYNYTKNGFQESTTAGNAIKVKVDGMNITFEDGLGNGNKISVTATGNIKDTLGISKDDTSIKTTYDTKLVEDQPTAKYLADKELGFTYNGTTKKISMADVLEKAGGKADNDYKDVTKDNFLKALNDEISKSFGDKKITADITNDGKLSFETSGQGNTLSIGGSAAEAMGFESGDSNYINTGRKLVDILGDKAEGIFKDDNRLKGIGDPIKKTSPNGSTYYVDKEGNRVDEKGYRVDKDNKAIYDLEINGAHINVTKDTTLESMMNAINSNSEAGMKVSYSKLTNEFKFTATETGANSKVEFGGLAQDLFGPPKDVEINHNFAENYGFSWLKDDQTEIITVDVGGNGIRFDVTNKTTMQEFAEKINSLSGNQLNASYNEETGQFTVTNKSTGKEEELTVKDSWGDKRERVIEPAIQYTAGRDAIMDVEINGVKFDSLTRSSNTFDIDGMNITVKDTFTTGVDKDGKPEEAVTFKTTTDSDKIVEAIASFVNDYNEMATEIKNAYSTMPAQKSNGARYEPLTAEQEDSYSETELKAYNEKAKQGILFGDTNLSSMYSKLLGAITPGGEDGQTLREIGIKTSYSDGMTTLTLDEDALRSALESDPDKVRTAFTKTVEGGSSRDGLMQTMQNTLNTYVKTTGEPKGVLITRAGSTKAPTSLNSNSLKTQMDSIDNQIDRWQDKMSDQIDRYTTKFSKLEQLIAQMNSQSSALAGLMGGSSGY